jgi:Reverse transcriptase (RNA-dependent DNA polymerase)
VVLRSAQAKHPSEALVRSEASERDIEEVAQLGKEWATNNTAGVQSAFVESIATTTTSSLPDPENFSLPNLYSEAMTCPDIWSGPIEKELQVMRDRKVWEEIDPPPDVCTIGTRWTFTNKYNSDGNLTGHKACLVAKGFTQIPGMDFFETYASVIRYESL